MTKIIYITGGQRSGKSSYAQNLALSLANKPIYMATSRIWDEEFRKRVKRHQADRDEHWKTIEEEKFLSRHSVEGEVVVIDCATLWSTNFFFDMNTTNDLVMKAIIDEFDKFTTQDATFIFVSNEIGMGGTSPDAVQRRFTDLLGWVNQYIASKADEVVFMVSGIPMKIK